MSLRSAWFKQQNFCLKIFGKKFTCSLLFNLGLENVRIAYMASILFHWTLLVSLLASGL